jgi:hypothetical protein
MNSTSHARALSNVLISERSAQLHSSSLWPWNHVQESSFEDSRSWISSCSTGMLVLMNEMGRTNSNSWSFEALRLRISYVRQSSN